VETGLRGRVAIVAAASQGLGFAVAKGLAAEGVKLAICSRDEKRIREAAERLRREDQADVLGQAVDVTDPVAVEKFVAATIERFGRLDICVTNAGGPPAKQFLDTTNAEWQKAIEANFLSVVYFAKQVIPLMQKNKWGRIITVTSVSVKQPVDNLVYSNAVRPAVVGLVKSLSNELGKDGILVNNVGPGYTATDRLKDLASAKARTSGASEQEIFEGWAADSAVKRVGTPEEFADVVVWLASERASNVTGQTILVDGGTYRGLM
jgi:3-oxoacyl-[acyl-carrier protein] reductase